MPESLRTVSPLRRVALLASAAIVIVAAIFAVVIYARRTPAPEKAPAIQARLELAAGEVRIDNGRGEVRAVSGTPLLANAKIRTDKGARALVRLPDGATVFLRAESALALAPSAVRLER